MAALALYGVTRKQSDFYTGRDLLGQAAELEPRNSLILQNYATELLADALLGLFDGKIDLPATRTNAELGMEEQLWQDERDRQACLKTLQAQPSFSKALNVLERLLILAPQSPEHYRNLETIYILQENLTGLQNLREKLKSVTLDHKELDYKQKYFAGEKDAELLKAYEGELVRCRKVLHNCSADPAAGGIVAAKIALLLLSLRSVSATVDYEEAVALAERGFKDHPSKLSRETLVFALASRGLEQLAKQETRLANWASKTRRSLDALTLLSYSASMDEELGKQLIQNSDVQRALALCKDNGRLFQKHRKYWELPLWRLCDPEEAVRVAAALNAPVLQIERELDDILVPLNGVIAVKAAVLKRDAGDKAGAQQILEKAAGRGIPLP